MMIPKHKLLGLLIVAMPFFAFAQENSPYSRYGVGNIVPAQNLTNRAMGGIAAGYSSPVFPGNFESQSINFTNPASYGNLRYTVLDIGGEVDSRTLINTSPLKKYTAKNAIISYLQFAVPLINAQKAIASKKGWALTFGLRPITKINYKIQSKKRISNIDSVVTLSEGSGGLNEAFVGTGFSIKNFSFGVNAGYLFGNKDYNTRVILVNDSVDYYSSNSATNTHIGGVFFNAGVQYLAMLNKKTVLRVGAFGRLKQNINASRDVIRETFLYNATTGNPDRIDSVFTSTGVKGKMVLPTSYGVGFTVENNHLLFGVDYEGAKWSDYRFFGAKDFVQNSWTIRTGLQYFPATNDSKKYFNFVKYRAGFYYGPDYINIGKEMPQYGVTFGAGFPLKLKRNFFDAQISTMNVALEYGSRGNKFNGVRENIFRIGVGFSLSDVWFRRYKYD